VWTPSTALVQLFHATSTGETVWNIQPCGQDGLCSLTRTCTNFDCLAFADISGTAMDRLRQDLAKGLKPVEPGPDAQCSTEMGFIGMLTQTFVVDDGGALETVYGRYGSEDLPACVSFESPAIHADGGLEDDKLLLTGPFDGYFTAASYDAFEDELEAYLQYCVAADGFDEAGICGSEGVALPHE
jgi:hypothetical protein